MNVRFFRIRSLLIVVSMSDMIGGSPYNCGRLFVTMNPANESGLNRNALKSVLSANKKKGLSSYATRPIRVLGYRDNCTSDRIGRDLVGGGIWKSRAGVFAGGAPGSCRYRSPLFSRKEYMPRRLPQSRQYRFMVWFLRTLCALSVYVPPPAPQTAHAGRSGGVGCSTSSST